MPCRAWDWWPLPMAGTDVGADSLCYLTELNAIASTGRYAPFYLTAGQHGRFSAAPFSGQLRAAIYKDATRPARWYDYDFAVDVEASAMARRPGYAQQAHLSSFPYWQRANGALHINRLYAHARLYIVDITAGVAPLTAYADGRLTSGDMLLSHNAPALPRISVGIDRYTAVPGLYGYLALRGGITHAWLTDNAGVRGAYLHYKYAGVRLGGKLPVNISYEFHHAAQWGGHSAEHGDLGNSWHDFRRILTAAAGGNTYNEIYNAQGNHLGSQVLELMAKGTGWEVRAYWQNFLEDNWNFLGRGQNLPDGLFGLSVEQAHWPYVQGLTVEYICTADQTGPFHDQDGLIYAGNDNYYRNAIYTGGWNYYLHTLGTPFITSPIYNREGEPATTNSRSKTCYLALRGDIRGYRYLLRASHSRNYGCYDDGGDIYALRSRNTAWLLSVTRHVEKAWGLDFSLALSGDIGSQFGSGAGAMLTIRKQGLITAYGNAH